MTEIYLVRHAKAGERRLWKDDDRLRPLSKNGWRQAEAIAKKLAPLDVGELLSSPYVRCVETLEPLAKRLATEVHVEDRLSEGEPVGPLLELLAAAPAGAVLCSHGDLIPAAVRAIRKSGVEIKGEADWRKGSIWVLRRNPHGDMVRATCWPPPVI